MRRFVFLVTLGILSFLPSFAQPGSGPPPDPGQPLPITGVEYLLLGGAAIGLRKLYLRKKNQEGRSGVD